MSITQGLTFKEPPPFATHRACDESHETGAISINTSPILRVSAIDFLNPAPLMWDFTHEPKARELATRYHVHLTKPALCAAELLAGASDLGLIPVAALTEELAVVSDCAIASLREVRSILLLVRERAASSLEAIRTVAVDTASRSSVAYVQVLFRHFLGTDPRFSSHAADPMTMLAGTDAALLIGDPALLARERRAEIEAVFGPCLWVDLAQEWHARTGLPWVAAVWAVRREALQGEWTAARLAQDLGGSRDRGLVHVDTLVREWSARISLPSATIHHYLTHNIHYLLDERCLEALVLFRELAASVGVLRPFHPSALEFVAKMPIARAGLKI